MNEGILKVVAVALLAALIGTLVFIFSSLGAKPSVAKPPAAPPPAQAKEGDQELAYLLVKLELQTRAVMAGHYGRKQSGAPGVDIMYKKFLVSNLILPAAVADSVFAETVPNATNNRAWVKMVVREPRNPNNVADATANEMMEEIIAGAANAERTAGGAYYYGEPIRTKEGCLRCHGEPAGAPDPSFPQYKKDGWKVDETIGAVISRVAPATP